MCAFQPNLMKAATASERMDRLSEFIEYWLGPREESYGEPSTELIARSLPMPLRRLYQFAGRWPGFDERNASPYAVGAFSTQDSLAPLKQIQLTDAGRLTFATENQGCWTCQTLPEGDDPPVWCQGDFFDADGNCDRGVRMVCDSLSRFLVTFVLQELTFGSRLSLCDETLTEIFQANISEATPLWLKGPYVHGDDTDFFLWRGILVSNLWGGWHFATNDPDGIRLLTSIQGPVVNIGLMAGTPWRLDIHQDGSARVRYQEGTLEEEAHVEPGTFRNFEHLTERLTELSAPNGDGIRSLLVFFHRQGQSSVQGRHFRDAQVVTRLFRMAITHAKPQNERLVRLLQERWAYC